MKIYFEENGISREVEIFSATSENSYFSGFYRIKNGEDTTTLPTKFKLPKKVLEAENEGIVFAPGVTIFVPKTEKRRYVVRPLDNIPSLSKKLGMSTEEIETQTGGKYLYLGQTILY